MPSTVAPAATFTAWVDESGSNHVLDPNTYILAAALCLTDEADNARERMKQLRLPGQRKVHWRDEDQRRHRKVTQTIAGLTELEHVVVVRSTDTPDRSERRRRKAMEMLLFQLTSLEVGRVVIESRGPADDHRDRQLLEAMRRRKALLGPIHMDHLAGPADPMLWVPDAVCGAVTEMRCGDAQYYGQLQTCIQMIEI